jgi:putative ATP-dependent endonuclease of OLD family
MNTRGDILFARALVFFEGDTEEQAIPDFAEKFWKKQPNELGYSFVGVGGKGNYLPFLRMATSFKIPWFIFSDGEANTVTAVNAALAAVGQDQVPNNPRVVVLPNGQDFETYLTSNATKQVLITTIIKHEAKAPQHEAALTAEWAGKSDADQTVGILEKLRANKTQYGSRVGKALPVPALLEGLFKKIDTEVG